jgi:catechol 2,3-dioxygenase-like lactoylglutathione lyase family enzyme
MDAAMTFEKVIPTLRMFDIEKTRDFYLDFLGFKVDFEHRFHEGAPLFMGVSRGSARLYLSQHHGDGSPGVHVTVEMKGVDAYHAEISVKPYAFYNPAVRETPWGSRDMNVIDPAGNQVNFSERSE